MLCIAVVQSRSSHFSMSRALDLGVGQMSGAHHPLLELKPQMLSSRRMIEIAKPGCLRVSHAVVAHGNDFLAFPLRALVIDRDTALVFCRFVKTSFHPKATYVVRFLIGTMTKSL